MGEMTETMQSLASADAPQARAAKQAELVKKAYERAVGNMRDWPRSRVKRRSGCDNRSEAMDEVKALASEAGIKHPG